MDEIRIVKAESRRLLKAFFSFSEKCGYTPRERSYIRKSLPGKYMYGAYLLARRGKRTCARLYTWTAPNGTDGYFAFPDGDPEALKLLFREAERQQGLWGSSSLTGPMLPDGSNLFPGIPNEDPGQRGAFLIPFRQGTAQMLKDNGYGIYSVNRAFLVRISDENPYYEAAQRAEKRFKLYGCILKNGFFHREIEKCVCELDTDCPQRAAAQAEKLRGAFKNGQCSAVFDRNGNCRGYALVLKGEPCRIVTLITKRDGFSAPAALILVSDLYESLHSLGIQSAELSVIDAGNAPSLALVRRVGGILRTEYLRYYKKIT